VGAVIDVEHSNELLCKIVEMWVSVRICNDKRECLTLILKDNKEHSSSKMREFDKSPASCKAVVKILCTEYRQVYDFSAMNITGMLNSCVGKTALKKLLW
jgi:hypothetical protein